MADFASKTLRFRVARMTPKRRNARLGAGILGNDECRVLSAE